MSLAAASSDRAARGDVYAGRDGNVYRKQGDGWQQYGDGGWNNVNTPNPQNRTGQTGQTGARTGQAGTQPASRPADSSTMSQLNRDSAARSTGAQRTQDLGSVRSGTTSRPSSYRPSGGMSRGGGARRGRGNPPPTTHP